MAPSKNQLFTELRNLENTHIPQQIINPFDITPHPIAQLAAKDLQDKLLPFIDHNFGLNSNSKDRPIGKMFGVLVVRNRDDKLGYLSAFSGKLSGGNHYDGFVPPVYDGLQEGGFLNEGMTQLSVLVKRINELQLHKDSDQNPELSTLIKQRSNHSKKLQEKLFESYHFINRNQQSKSLLQIFKDRKPPGGSGECAAPKLLQYAFMNNLQPIAIAEFWWGISPKSQLRNHKEYYPACDSKCSYILKWMLS